MNLLCATWIVVALANSLLYGQTAIFEDFKFDQNMLEQWSKSDFAHEPFCRLPSNLSDDKTFMNHVDEAKNVARRGSYMNMTTVKNEIVGAINTGQFAPVFGWGSTFINCPQDIEFCCILSELIHEKNPNELNFLLAHTIDGIVGEYPAKNSIALKTKSITDKNIKLNALKNLGSMIKKMKNNGITVKSNQQGGKGCYLDYLIKQIESIE